MTVGHERDRQDFFIKQALILFQDLHISATCPSIFNMYLHVYTFAVFTISMKVFRKGAISYYVMTLFKMTPV